MLLLCASTTPITDGPSTRTDSSASPNMSCPGLYIQFTRKSSCLYLLESNDFLAHIPPNPSLNHLLHSSHFLTSLSASTSPVSQFLHRGGGACKSKARSHLSTEPPESFYSHKAYRWLPLRGLGSILTSRRKKKREMERQTETWRGRDRERHTHRE